MDSQRQNEQMPLGWQGWYLLARAALEYSHPEAVLYANVRSVEDENRRSLDERAA